MTTRIPISMRARLGVLPLLAALTAGLLSGCDPSAKGGGSADFTGRKIKVTTTVGMVAETARHVGGDRVEVTALMGPGVDPHLYKASQGDIQRLADADVVFYNGLHLEGKMGEVLEKIGGSGKPTVPVAEAIESSKLRSPPEFKGQHDPHVWFDVSMWSETIAPVVETLSKMDPNSAAKYQANGEAYKKTLAELDAYCKKQLATIPKDRRVLITAHDAFGYFGRAYDIEVVGLQGISTVSEYGIRDIQDRVDLIARRKVKAVFVESSVPRRSIEAVVAGCKAQGHTVSIGGTLYSDAMGDPGTDDGTYPGMVRHNVDTIVAALK